MRVQEYIREDNSNPYQSWFDSLDAIAAAKVAVAKTRLELGNTSSIKWFDGIGEYRIGWGQVIEFTWLKMVSSLLSCLGVERRKVSSLILNR
jgi:putative component of toxin-antitoxin plasmid stabilization module